MCVATFYLLPFTFYKNNECNGKMSTFAAFFGYSPF